MTAVLVIVCLNLLLLPINGFDITSPTESLYQITLRLSNGCNGQDDTCIKLSSLLYYKECKVVSSNCNKLPSDVTAEVSFTRNIDLDTLRQNVNTLITSSVGRVMSVDDVNECSSHQNKCSKYAFCINLTGSYQCQCMFAYADSKDSTMNGTKCVERCSIRSCKNDAICKESTNENEPFVCECRNDWTGSDCNIRVIKSSLPDWAIILISIFVVIAALIGIALCAYSGYRLFCKREFDDDASEGQSIMDYKPKSLPHEYKKFTDMDSVSRGSAANAGFTGINDEDDQEDQIYVRNDGLRFNAKKLEDKLTTPTESISNVRSPYVMTDRHTLSEVGSQDFY